MTQTIPGSPISLVVWDNGLAEIKYLGLDLLFGPNSAVPVVWVPDGLGSHEVHVPYLAPAYGTGNLYPHVPVSNVLSALPGGWTLEVKTALSDTGLHLSQLFSYQEGETTFTNTVTLENQHPSYDFPDTHVFWTLDTYINDNDDGYGFLDPLPGDMAWVGVESADRRLRLRSLIPLSNPDMRYMQDVPSTIYGHVGNEGGGPGPGLANTVLTTLHEAGFGVEYAIAQVPVGGQVVVAVHTLEVLPLSARRTWAQIIG